MKSHSYFRTKLLYLKDNNFKAWVPPRRKTKDSEEKEEPPKIKITLGDFYTEVKRFSYFFVCPTLIYRDEYTLTPLRSTTSILFNFINFMACIYYGKHLLIKLSFFMSCFVKITLKHSKKNWTFTHSSLLSSSLCYPLSSFFYSDFLDFCIAGWTYGLKSHDFQTEHSILTGGTHTNSALTIENGTS